MIMMYYIVSFLSISKELASIRGGEMLQGLLSMGVFVVAVFALIFLYYTNSFLIRKRKKELGLYNILGMGKRNLVRILLWENILTAVISLVIGIVFGILFSKLAELLAIKLLDGATGFGVHIEMKPILMTVGLFLAIFLLIMIRMLVSVYKLRPIEMLRSENVGEKPPKANWLNKDKYTEESWNKLQKAVNSARELLNKKDEETCTSEMNDKANEVRNARNSLQEIKVDTSALNDALKAAKSISREGYTEESFEALTQSILEAEALLNGTYTQKEVDEKTAVLIQRMKDLRADKTLLQEKYNKIKDMTQGNATDASWNDFTRLRELANAILTDPNATPAEVSDILNQLNTFEFAYKDDPDEGGNKDPQEPLEPQNPQNPNSGNQGNTNTSHADTSVKTGDSTPLLLPLATMCSIIGLLYIMHKKRKLG